MTEKEKTRCIYSHSMDMKLHLFSFFFPFLFLLSGEFFLVFDLNSFPCSFFKSFKNKTSIYGGAKIIVKAVIGYLGHYIRILFYFTFLFNFF